VNLRNCTLALAGMVAFAASGCGYKYTFKMEPELPIRDETSVAPQLKEKKFSKIIVIPPSGTARGQFDREINFFEREFLNHNLTVISAAVTGRVVFELKGNEGEKREEGAQGLSDAERALVMAKKTGADAILQIGTFAWQGRRMCRYFVGVGGNAGSQTPSDLKEVTLKEYEAHTGARMPISGQWLEFVGRLIDVQSGEVMASFKYGNSPMWNLPSSYTAVIKDEGSGPVILSESYSLTGGTSLREAEDKAVERVVGAIAKRISGR
jgi:hypothetical protein